ncbi:MAG: phosphatidylglycerophosphatase A [Oxalicibacterium faecigallinarum]|uniref:Phosphatidylglycerophosphatase A n=1 Tax=Oxalicibacterium faecigallinarum TaxID=573741 RepID=A0A8J3APJ7_9BURK|nr:phosphatidylglycerophosphatase A [Oxalicibacterium faecigallinarum]MDQ7968657.1 phosphatidylglycerophosphatase A [Oxalicibacterium faecigallinarum]GGI18646.1 phosphatidylglycerophosphatase A [Oxalicibacterium faecigallinarum]
MTSPASSEQRAPTVHPNSTFMRRHPAHLLAMGFGSGLPRIMPGTFGTLFGWLSFVVLTWRFPDIFTPWAWAFFISIGFIVGIWACNVTGRNLGVSDHGSMVWDEIIAIWLVMLFVMPASLGMQFAAFLIFRLFDMIKPPPIRQIERRFKDGFGVMIDDLIAAFLTLLVIAIWMRL